MMRFRLPIKALAIVLAALALVSVAFGALGIYFTADCGVYTNIVPELVEESAESEALEAADILVREYIRENLSGMTENQAQYASFYQPTREFYDSYYADRILTYTLSHAETGQVLATGGIGKPGSASPGNVTEYTFHISHLYPKLVAYEKSRSEEPTDSIIGDYSGPLEVTYAPLDPLVTTVPSDGVLYDDCYTWFVGNSNGGGEYYDFYFQYLESDEYTVTLTADPDLLSGMSSAYLEFLWLLSVTNPLFPYFLVIGLIVLAVSMAYLIAAAGRKHGREEIIPRGLNALPLDLYTVILGFGTVIPVMLGAAWFQWLLENSLTDLSGGLVLLCPLAAFVASLVTVCYFFAFAAQIKAGHGYWWRRSLIGRLLLLVVRGCVRLVSSLSCMWQWMLVTVLLCAALLFSLFLLLYYPSTVWLVLFMAVLLVAFSVAGYGAYAFSLVLKGARKMARGDLHQTIPTEHLMGCFADCAQQLNTLAEVAVVAAQKEMRSERMKTELITNVSHDIKTPLTSIINYVDLLQKPHTPDQETEYLAVLSRQSSRMKKLIDDLMEMSKAATGNLATEIVVMDAKEVVTQALGEFSDKLAAVSLSPVLRGPDGQVPILADGRLVWRTMSNLLQNTVKYALPGTRLYVDISQTGDRVTVSLKNISREPLNISADELMERFVRGDTSRNTEGSGLGLNIARSLMELQGGRLELTVDGDLFKASLIFPAVTEPA